MKDVHSHTPVRCPTCGALHRSSVCIDGERAPANGDITVCWTCGDVLGVVVESHRTALVSIPIELREYFRRVDPDQWQIVSQVQAAVLETIRDGSP